jgi:hypothetical protein
MHRIMTASTLALALLTLAACGQIPARSPASATGTSLAQRLRADDAEVGLVAWLEQQDGAWVTAHTPAGARLSDGISQQNRPLNCGLPFPFNGRWYQICVDDDTWEYSIRRYYWW